MKALGVQLLDCFCNTDCDKALGVASVVWVMRPYIAYVATYVSRSNIPQQTRDCRREKSCDPQGALNPPPVSSPSARTIPRVRSLVSLVHRIWVEGVFYYTQQT